MLLSLLYFAVQLMYVSRTGPWKLAVACIKIKNQSTVLIFHGCQTSTSPLSASNWIGITALAGYMGNPPGSH
jgi:hypothetical protein